MRPDPAVRLASILAAEDREAEWRMPSPAPGARLIHPGVASRLLARLQDARMAAEVCDDSLPAICAAIAIVERAEASR